MKVWKVFAAIVLAGLASCGGQAQKKDAGAAEKSLLPSNARLGNFSADSAYNYIAEQVAFGPRVPGTPGHKVCRDYIIGKMRALADTVYVQDAEVTAYTGETLPITNIIAQFNPEATRRVVLAAHWDTRPWADQSDNAEDRKKPVPGANDGGSGVGVLLEIARQLAQKAPVAGVDLIFFDAEDYGRSGSFDTAEETWCLGSQYWADNIVPYTAGNLPVYGILLDMVGGANARFYYEHFATQHAETPCVKVWSEAQQLGYDEMFPRTVGGVITDDHIVMTRAGIPTTNVIELKHIETGSFPPYWHTVRDDMSNIDRRTLQAVGEVVLNVVYKERG